MKYVEPAFEGDLHLVELTRRNLLTLLVKLDEPSGQRTIIDPDNKVKVRAVEDDEHYADRDPGPVYMPDAGVLIL